MKAKWQKGHEIFSKINIPRLELIQTNGCIFRMAALHLGYLRLPPPPLDGSKGTTTLSQCIFSLRFNLALFRMARSSFLANNSMLRGSGDEKKYFFTFFGPSFPSNSSPSTRSEKAHFASLIILSLRFVSNFITHFLSSLNLQLLFRSGEEGAGRKKI